MTTETTTLNAEARADRAIAVWLLGVAAMVAVMVVVGGITRLTGSGLSMVEWRPLIGWLPPLTDEQWVRTFALYQNSPEYLRVNTWMGIEDFKRIFWWEYGHRLLGRLIGLAFALPFLWFLLRRQVRRPLIPRLVVLFILGGLQGAIGWWMVKSGLVDDPAVSQYRLAVHLSMAFVILGALLWTAMELLDTPTAAASVGLRRHAVAGFALISITVVAGALVAGLDAGMIHNTFPKMSGEWVPADYLHLAPGWLNLFENPTEVQFNHRILALVTLVVILTLLWRAMRSDLPAFARLPVHVLAAMSIIQVILGVATLLTIVPVDLAAMHQGGAVLLFSAALWVVYGLRRAP